MISNDRSTRSAAQIPISSRSLAVTCISECGKYYEVRECSGFGGGLANMVCVYRKELETGKVLYARDDYQK